MERNEKNEAFYSYRKSEIGEYVRIKKEKHETLTRGFRFQITNHLKPKWVKPKDRAPIRHLTTPDTLAQLACNVIRKIPMPEAFWWTNTEVLQWIENFGFFQYKTTFFENQITGQNLLFLEAKDLQAMNIKPFENIVKIAHNIRQMYGIEMIRFARSISLPPRYPFTHCFHYRGFTGYKYAIAKSYDVWRMEKFLHKPPDYLEHWNLLHRHITNRRWLYIEPYMIGYCPRFELYKTKSKPRKSQHNVNLITKVMKKEYCTCDIVPCVCGKSYQKTGRSDPFQFLSLINQKMEFRKNMRSNHGENIECECVAICTCDLDIENVPQTLTVLRQRLPERYDTAAIHKSIPQDVRKPATGRSAKRKSILSRKLSGQGLPNL